jgi:predicted enzyme related to lactoylglutathione lyase
MAEPGHVWWTELMTSDVDKAARFYGEVMGWRAVKVASGDPRRLASDGEATYTVFRKGDETVCGVFRMEGKEFANIPDYWFTYISVDDVDAACERVARVGGQVLKPPYDIANVGRVAVICDPEGAVVGIGTPVVS